MYAGKPLEDDVKLSGFEDLSTLDVEVRMLGGKNSLMFSVSLIYSPQYLSLADLLWLPLSTVSTTSSLTPFIGVVKETAHLCSKYSKVVSIFNLEMKTN